MRQEWIFACWRWPTCAPPTKQTLPQETWAAALEVVRELLENWFEKPAETITPPALVDGDDLMNELDLPARKKDR